MWDFAPKVDKLDSITAVLTFVRDLCTDAGVVRMSYHFSPIFDEPVSLHTIVYAHGFPNGWLDNYRDPEFRKNDPIPGRTFDNGAYLPWKEAMRAAPNTPAQKHYFEQMIAAGLVHGFGVPLYGPRGREAYSSFDFDRPLSEVDRDRIGQVRLLAQSAHIRISHLIDEESDADQLSTREAEVLTWMAKGKTAQDIATILDLSPETVRTYVKRLYEKLDINDRIGAVVRGLKLGLIKL